jgi:DNA polymerase-3 subunit delta
VFWKDKADLAHQLRRWRGRALARLLERLVGLHRDMLSHSQDAELLLAQSLGEIARMAARVR